MADNSKIGNLDEATSTKDALFEAAGIPKGLGDKFNHHKVLANFDSQMDSLVTSQRTGANNPTDEDVGSDDDTYSLGSDEMANDSSTVSNYDTIRSDACLKKLMAEGKDLSQITEEGECLLSLASANGYLDLVQVMLAMNRDSVDERGPKNDLTPLMEAVINGHEDCAKVLIEHGASVNAQSENGNTPLHFACANGHMSIARELLDKGAGIEDQNENGHTPLMEAASNGFVETAQLLLLRGAGINAYSSEFKESALTLACYKGHYDMVKFLLEAGADQDHQTEEMHTALMEACMDGHYEVAKLLIDHGAKVNMPTESFESPLTLAACGGHLQLANLLIEKGASLEEVNDEGYSPLMEAAREGHEAMVMLLVNCGANVNAQTEETQETALTLACYNGFINIAKYLLDTAGADVNGGGSSPLMEAAHQGHVDLVKFLITSGADIHLETGGGDTALSFACENGHNEVAEILLNCGAKLEHESEGGRTPLMKAARAGHVCTVQFLVSRGADVNRLSLNEDHTPLSLACSGDHKNVVELLLEHGADPSVRLKDGSNALIEATKAGNTQIVRLLLEYSPCISDALTETHDLMSGADLQPRVPTQALPNMVPPAQQNPIAINVPRRGVTQGTPPCQIHSYSCARYHNQVQQQQQSQPQLTDATLSPQESYFSGSNQQCPNSLASNQLPASQVCCEHLLPHQSAKLFQCDDNSYHEKEQKIAENLQKERDELLKKKARLLNEKSEMCKNVQIAATQYLEQQQQYHAQNQAGALIDGKQQNSYLQTSQIQHWASSCDGLCNEQSCNEPSCDAKHGSNCGKTVHTRVACCEHHAQMGAASDARPATVPPYLEGGFSAANPLAATGTKNMGMPKVENSKQCLVNNLNRPPGSNLSRQNSAPASQQMLSSTASLSGLPFDGSIDNIDVSFPLSMMPYQLNNATIDSAILEKLKQLPPEEQQKLLELTNSLASAIDNAVTSPEISNLLQLASHSQLQPQTRSPQSSTGSLSQQQQQAIATTFSTGQSSHQKGGPVDALTQVAHPADFLNMNMESMVTAAGLMAAAGVDCSADPSILASQRVFDLLNQGYTNDKFLAEHQLAASFQRMGLENEQSDQQSQGEVLLAPNPSPTEGANTPNRPSSPSENVPPTYIFRPGDNMYQTANPATLLNTNAAFPALTPEQMINLNNNATANRTTQTALAPQILPPGVPPAMVNPQTGEVVSGSGGLAMMHPSRATNTLVEVNAQTDSNNDTPLTIAAAAGNRDIVRELLKSKADIEHKDKKGFTPLILAASGGHVEVVRLLLESEAQLEATSERTKDTALSLACSGGKEEVVCVLLEKGANIEHRNVSDYTPLSLAASGGYIKIIKMLLNTGAEINSRTGSRLGISPLMLAAMNGHSEAVKLLLDHGSDINAQIESNRNTALTLACYQGRHEVVSLLLERRANMEHRAKSGLTPLMEAASGGYADVGRVLLDHGADVNALPVPASRDTALTIAADKGHYNFCEVVVARGANVEARNKKGGTPLWLACNGGHLDVAMMLVTSGADVDAQDNRKISCLMAAFRRGHVKVLRYLVKKVSQFPGNLECLRYIATLSDNDLIKRCNQCLDIIANAKDKQAEQANKNATSLLQELDDEKCREEKQKEAAARKREKRRQKKKQQKSNSSNTNEADGDGKDSADEESNEKEPSKPNASCPVGDQEKQVKSGTANRKNSKLTSVPSEGGGGESIHSESKENFPEDEPDFDTLLGLVDSVSLSSSGNSAAQATTIRNTNAVVSGNASNKKKGKKEPQQSSQSSSNSVSNETYSPRRSKNKTVSSTPRSVQNGAPVNKRGNTSDDARKGSRSANDRESNKNSGSSLANKSSTSRSTSGGKPNKKSAHSIAAAQAAHENEEKKRSGSLPKHSKGGGLNSHVEVVISNGRPDYEESVSGISPGLSKSQPHYASGPMFTTNKTDGSTNKNSASSQQPISVNLSPNGVIPLGPTVSSSLSVAPSSKNGNNNVSPRKPARRGEEGWKEVPVPHRKSVISKKTMVPGSAISRVIGRQGCNINAIREATCAHIEIDKQQPKGQSERRTVNIRGSAQSVHWAEKLIDILIEDPAVDILQHIPNNLAQMLSASNNASSTTTAASNPTSTNVSSSAKKPTNAQSAPTAVSSVASLASVTASTFAQVHASKQQPQTALSCSNPGMSFDPSRASAVPFSAKAPGSSAPTFGVIGSKPPGQMSQQHPRNSAHTQAPSAWKNGSLDGTALSYSGSGNNYGLLKNILDKGPSTKIWDYGSNSAGELSRHFGNFPGPIGQAPSKEVAGKSSQSASGQYSQSFSGHQNKQPVHGASLMGSGLSSCVNMPPEQFFSNESEPSSLFSSSASSVSPETSHAMTTANNAAHLNVSLGFSNSSPPSLVRSRHLSGGSSHGDAHHSYSHQNSPKVSPPLASNVVQTPANQVQMTPQKEMQSSVNQMNDGASPHPGSQQQTTPQISEKRHQPAPIGSEKARAAKTHPTQQPSNHGIPALNQSSSNQPMFMPSGMDPNSNGSDYFNMQNYQTSLDKTPSQPYNALNLHPHALPHAQHAMSSHHNSFPMAAASFLSQQVSSSNSFNPATSSAFYGPPPQQPPPGNQQDMGNHVGSHHSQNAAASHEKVNSNTSPNMLTGGPMRNMGPNSDNHQAASIAAASHSIPNLYSQASINGNLSSVPHQMVAPNSHSAAAQMNQFRVPQFYPTQQQQQQAMMSSHHSAIVGGAGGVNNPLTTGHGLMNPVQNGFIGPYGVPGANSNLNVNGPFGFSSSGSAHRDLTGAFSAGGGYSPYLGGSGFDCERAGLALDERSSHMNVASQYSNNGDAMHLWSSSISSDYNQP